MWHDAYRGAVAVVTSLMYARYVLQHSYCGYHCSQVEVVTPPQGLCRGQYTFSEIIKTTIQKLAVAFQSTDTVTLRSPNHEFKASCPIGHSNFLSGFLGMERRYLVSIM